MAEITQDIRGTDAPNFLGYSKGTDRPQPNRSFEAILGGVQNTLAIGVQGVDQAIKKDITDSLYAGIDPIRDSQGVSTVLEGNNPQGLFPSQTLPSTVQSGLNDAQRLKSAFDAGKISDTTYWARTEAVVRQLRARYPGYREQIDSAAAGITGSIPANALRRSILSDLEQAQNASNATANRQQAFIYQNLEFMSPETRAKVLSNKPYDFNQVALEVGEKQAYQKEIEVKRAEIGYAKDSNNLNSENAQEGYIREANGVADQVISNFQSVLKANNIDVATLVTTGASPEQDAAVRGMFAQARVAIVDQLNGIANSPLTPDSPNTWSTVINDPTKVKNIQQQAIARIDSLEAAYFNKDYGALNAHANYATASKKADTARLLRDNDAVRRLNVASELLGPDGLSLISSSTNILSDATKAVANMTFVNMVTTDTDLTTELNQAKANGVTDPKALNGIINSSINVLTSNTTDIRAKGMVASNLFGPKSIGSLDKFNPSERMAIFTRLASPDVTAAMNKIKGSYPMAWEAYSNWALNSFGALFKQETSDLQNTIVYDKGVNVTFDAKNLRFQASLTPEARREQQQTGTVRDPNNNPALVKVNTGLSVIKPIITANGQNPGEVVTATLSELGIDTSAAKQNTLGEKVFNAIGEAVGQAKENVGSAVSNVAPSRTLIQALSDGWNRPAQGTQATPQAFNDIWGNASTMPASVNR